MTDFSEAKARAAAESVAATVSLLQRIFMPHEELVVLLMNTYAKGAKMAYDESVLAFTGKKSPAAA